MLTKTTASLLAFLLLIAVLSTAGCASDGMMMDSSMDERTGKSMMDDSDEGMKESMGEEMRDSM